MNRTIMDMINFYMPFYVLQQHRNGLIRYAAVMNVWWQKRLVTHKGQFRLDALCFLLHLIHSFILDVQCQLPLIVTASLILTASQTQVEVLVDSPLPLQFIIHCSHSEVTRVMVAQLHCILFLVSFHLLVYFGILKIARQVIMPKYLVGIFLVLCGC